MIYTFILYAIGKAYLKSHYKISINGNVLHLNSLDVERYYGNYIDPTEQQTSRILQDIPKANNIREEEIRNNNIKPKLVKSSNYQRNRLIIDNKNELHLKTKSMQSENAYIDGKSEFYGDVKFGNTTKPVNVKIDNGGFTVKNLTVTDSIDLGKAKFVWDSSDQLAGSQYKNIKIGEMSIKTLNIESELCNVEASSITKINGVSFTSPHKISSDSDLILEPSDVNTNSVIINGETKMQTISLGNELNGGKIYVGLKDKTFDDNDATVMKLYINNKKQSVIETYAVDTQSTIKTSTIYTNNIGLKTESSTDISLNKIKLLNSLDGDGQTISVTNIKVDNLKVSTIECQNKDTNGRCKDVETLSVNKIVNMNNYYMIGVGTLQVNSILSNTNGGTINLLSDLNLNNKNIENVNTLKVDNIQTVLGLGKIKFNSNIDVGTNSISATSITADTSISTPIITSAGVNIEIDKDIKMVSNNIECLSLTSSTFEANSIKTNEISASSSKININNDLDLGTNNIKASSIIVNEVKTNQLNIPVLATGSPTPSCSDGLIYIGNDKKLYICVDGVAKEITLSP